MPSQLASRRGFPLRFLSLTATLFLGAWSAAGSTTAEAATELIRVPAAAPGLGELGLALDHVAHAGNEVLLAASEWDLSELKAAGIPYVTVIADLEQHYATRLESERSLWAAAERGGGFGFGSMGGYYTFAEVVAKLDEMRANYPQLVTAKQSLGLSHLGRDVWMVKISDNPGVNENEPEMLYTSVTHAREPQGMMLLIYYMFSSARELRHRSRGHVPRERAGAPLRTGREPRRLRPQPDHEPERGRDVAEEPPEQRRRRSSAST